MAEARPEKFRVSLFSLRLFGSVECGNDEHDLSGFKVPENFREAEFVGVDNDGWLFWFVRLMGVHLFWFGFPAGVARRAASPPLAGRGGAGSRLLPATHRGRGGVCARARERRERALYA